MTTHVTHRFWAVLWAAAGCLTLAVLQREPLWVAMAIPLLLLLAGGAVVGAAPSFTTLSASLDRDRAIEGDVVRATIEVGTERSIPWLELELQTAGSLQPLGPLRHITALGAGDTLHHRIDLRAARFGVTGLQWLTVVCRDPFGLTERVTLLPLQPSLRVHPPTETLQRLLPPHRVRSVSGDHRSRDRGEGTELAEVRPYRPGDPARRVHSRISGRRGRPMVLERHPERSADVVLYLDSVQDIGVDLETTLRWTVMAAHALARRHHRSMDRVGLLDRGAGVRWLPPVLDRHALHDIVEVLLRTSALAQGPEEFPSPPIHEIPAGATVYAISPLLADVVQHDLLGLRRRRHQVVVVRPDLPPAPTATLDARRILRIDRELRRLRLARAGIAVVDWDPARSLESTLRRATPTVARMAGQRTATGALS